MGTAILVTLLFPALVLSNGSGEESIAKYFCNDIEYTTLREAVDACKKI